MKYPHEAGKRPRNKFKNRYAQMFPCEYLHVQHVCGSVCVNTINTKFKNIYAQMFPCEYLHVQLFVLILQSTLVILKSTGPSETLRDIRISTYQIWRIEENTSGTSKFHKWTCDLTPLVRYIG